jgi:hypothetical protein
LVSVSALAEATSCERFRIVVRRQSAALHDQLPGEDWEHGQHGDGQDDPGTDNGDSSI